MYKYATAIGLDIGRTMIRTALVRYDGKIFENFSFPYKKQADRDLLITYIVDALRFTRSLSVEYKINPLCVGIAAMGFIDYRTGTVIGPDQGIKGWTNVPLGKILASNLGLPVFVDNDANLMALAETSFGIATGNKNILFVALRSGIGGALIIDGKMFRGLNNAAGEIGQMSINYKGPESVKGVKGSFEFYASSAALVKRFTDLAGRHGKKKNKVPVGIRAKDVFDLYYRGDPDAEEAVKENAYIIGCGLANLVSVFAPEIIVLGGGMSLARDSYLDLVRKSVEENTLGYCSSDLKIERASLGNTAAVMGAGLFALTCLDGKSI
ncbi:MAG: ROK family protein [Marinilabiliaceae bacterium]|jgi:glucokinase|nr:ROK family protein [Marinilabiliaceae bacterium]